MLKHSFEQRLIVFAAECVFFTQSLPKTSAGDYYADQLLRASGSAALHYGEAQGTNTIRDFIYKVSGTLKELKECSVILKILHHINYGTNDKLSVLNKEVHELASIAAKMILNKKARNSNRQ